MNARFVRSLLTGALMAVMAAAMAGCARDEVGLYAEAKEDWSSPRPAEVEDSLRDRLAAIQTDR